MHRLFRSYPSWVIAISFAQGGAVLVFMSFAGALPLIQSEWGLSNFEAGAIQSAGQVGYLLSVLLISSLTDYIDSKWLILSGVLWAGMSNLMLALFAGNVPTAILLRGLVGFGIAGIYMPGLKLIAQRIPPEGRGRAVGLFVSFFTLGGAVSIAVGGTLSSMMGWRSAFAWMTLGPLMGGLIVWRFLARLEQEKVPSGSSRSIRELLQNRQVLVVILLYICHAWEVLGLRSWLAAYLTELRTQAGENLALATANGAAVAGLATLGAALATASIGAVSDRFKRLNVIAGVMALGLITVTLLGGVAALPWLVVVLISLAATFIANADSAVISTQLTEVVPQEYLGRVLAIYSFLGFSAGSISPLVFGAALDLTGPDGPIHAVNPWFGAFGTFAAASLVGLIAVYYLKNSARPSNGLSDL